MRRHSAGHVRRARVGRLLGPVGAALLVLSLALVAASGAACTDSVETRVVFLRDWEAAKEQAASENKPIMVNFYTDT